MEINVLVDEGCKGSLCLDWLQRLARQVLVAQGMDPNAELSLVVTGSQQVQALNQKYLGKNEPTDVIAFSMLPASVRLPEVAFISPPDGLWHLGEVILCFHRALAQAEEHCHSLERELAILLTHGVLHLLGYDDTMPEPKCIMSAREAEILDCLDID